MWTGHGIRILSGPSPLWLDAFGKRLPTPLFPGFDALGTLRHILATGRSHSWFLLDLHDRRPRVRPVRFGAEPGLHAEVGQAAADHRAGGKITPPVQAFLDKGVDFLTAPTVAELVGEDERPGRRDLIDADDVATTGPRCATARCASGLGKDPQVVAVRRGPPVLRRPADARRSNRTRCSIRRPGR